MSPKPDPPQAQVLFDQEKPSTDRLALDPNLTDTENTQHNLTSPGPDGHRSSDSGYEASKSATPEKVDSPGDSTDASNNSSRKKDRVRSRKAARAVLSATLPIEVASISPAEAPKSKYTSALGCNTSLIGLTNISKEEHLVHNLSLTPLMEVVSEQPSGPSPLWSQPTLSRTYEIEISPNAGTCFASSDCGKTLICTECRADVHNASPRSSSLEACDDALLWASSKVENHANEDDDKPTFPWGCFLDIPPPSDAESVGSSPVSDGSSSTMSGSEDYDRSPSPIAREYCGNCIDICFECPCWKSEYNVVQSAWTERFGQATQIIFSDGKRAVAR